MAKAAAIYLFATKSDLEPGLRSIESQRDLKYILMGSFETAEINVIKSAFEITDLAISTKGDHVHEDSYLVMDSEAELNIREIPQRRGGNRYIVDGLINPHAIVFRPSGRFTNLAVIRGEIDGSNDDPISMGLYKLFVAEITKGFKKVKTYYVGPEALSLSKGRIRLTHSIHTSSEYDLKVE